ncbi:transglutaminase-like domain-containing protein [Allorhodopirellula solitaria]|uniref:Transglutaminase-like superfamily protein n=1 Tax=Allorhodopirellula solitaria TaxID=2527987 RepID=A0A5C5YHV1_9BACT|nr:transglutaminase-like domain-containing protein [Allorhodopirellula solitaria]TWT73352.1 Transglutaminase-like superfamily protein [Allorhodopirellula solitaria]
MLTWSRRRVETILLALISLGSIVSLRTPVETQLCFVSEMAVIAVLGLLAMARPSRIQEIATGALPLIPIAFAVIARFFATPIALEMTALTVLGTVSLAMALGGRSTRWLALSVVSSGFLVLFCSSISDSRYAVALPIIWILSCVWHLIANHWEQLDMALPESVARNWTLRPATMIATVVTLAGAGYVAQDRFTRPPHLLHGFMPTSGGSRWSDPAARSGVGTGESAIAAKDHAESFGAVDSDIFLESTESSLLDMFNDMVGEPKAKKNRREKAQAMPNQDFLPNHERTARSDLGSSSFSVDRMPPSSHRLPDDVTDSSVIQWDGPTGIRLAMHRYDTFDGTDWTQSTDLTCETLKRIKIGEDSWFVEPEQHARIDQDASSISVGLLKIIRLDSTRMPVPMMTTGVHIEKIDRQDFFGIARDGCFQMPGREKIPALTVIHVASTRPSEDELRLGLQEQTATTPPIHADLRSLADRVTREHEHAYDQLQAIVTHLRNNFTCDRSFAPTSDQAVSQFLDSRRGGDHLFATTAALLARELGLQSRFVTGFYVRPDAFDITAGHASVLPRDVHAWAEVRLADGRWFEIEPSPGYQRPDYRPSIWLASQQLAATYWPLAAIVVAASLAVFLSRRIWIEWLLTSIWRLTSWFYPQGNLRVAIWVIEARARLAGCQRSSGRPQRDWLEELTQPDLTAQAVTRQFCDAADARFFSSSQRPIDDSSQRLVRLLNTRTLSQLAKELPI